MAASPALKAQDFGISTGDSSNGRRIAAVDAVFRVVVLDGRTFERCRLQGRHRAYSAAHEVCTSWAGFDSSGSRSTASSSATSGSVWKLRVKTAKADGVTVPSKNDAPARPQIEHGHREVRAEARETHRFRVAVARFQVRTGEHRRI